MNQGIPRRWGGRLSPTARGSLFYLGISGASATFFPFINVFFADRGLSGREIGLLSAVGPLVALFGAPLLTALADRRGWQGQMLTGGLAGVALTTSLVPLAQPYVLLLLVVLGSGLIGSTVGSISDGMIAQMAVRNRINYGKMRLWGSAGWVVMSLLGGVLWPLVGLSLMFPLASLLFLVTMSVAILLSKVGSGAHVERPPLRLTSGTARFWAVLICAVFMSLGTVMARTFSAIYIARLSGPTLVGLYAAIAAAIEIPIILWAEHIMRRVGGPFTLAIACLFMGTAFVGLAIIPRPELLLFSAVLEGIGFGLFITSSIRMVAGWSPPGQVATYQGLLNAGASGLAPLAAGLLGGAIFDAAGPQTVFVVSAGAATIAVAVLLTAQLRGLFPSAEDAIAAPISD
jgi:MFS transporter, PPP family, 3-phenylpropionic acid transporter